MKQRRYVQLSVWHKIFMVLGGIASLWSWKWSFNIFYALFSDVLTAGMIATMITFLELYSIYQIVMTGHWGWIVLASFGFVSSVMGSFGNFQTSYEKNVQKSDAYSRLEGEINRLEDQLKGAQKAKDDYNAKGWPGNAKREQNNIDKYQTQKDEKMRQLDEMKTQGAGTSNAIFRSVARHFNISAMDAAERMNLALGIFVECFMLLATAISATGMRDGEAVVERNGKRFRVSYDEEGNQHLVPYQPGQRAKTIEHPEPKRQHIPQPSTAEHRPRKEIGFRSSENAEKKTPYPTADDGKDLERGSITFSNQSGGDRDYSKMGAKGNGTVQKRIEKDRQKLRQHIANVNPNPSVQEVCQLLNCSPNTARSRMQDVGL